MLFRSKVSGAVGRIKRHTDLPVVVGFGVKNGDHAESIARGADGVVVGSALIAALEATYDPQGRATAKSIPAVEALVRDLAAGVRRAARQPA